MYQVLIADDEPWVAYRLTRLVDWECFGFSILGTAQDGVEALEKCRSLRPDVLVSDIRMPGFNGLEVLEHLRLEQLPIEVVLVSGYSEFSYAQQALRLGAFDYLVKQVAPEQLEDLLTRLSTALAQRRHGTDAYYALLNADSRVSIRQWLGEESYAFCHVATFAIADGEYPQMLYRHSEPGFRSLILRTGRGKATAVLCYPDPHSAPQTWPEVASYCGLSVRASTDTPFWELYQQSDIAFQTAQWLQDKAILRYHPMTDDSISMLTDDLEKALDDPNVSGHLLDALRAACKDQMADGIAALHNRLAAMRARRDGTEADMLDYRRLVSEYATLDDLLNDWRGGLLRETLSDAPILAQLLRVLDEDYTKDLKLSEIAARFHFSPNYLSTLFHKQTGKTFTHYIADKRIDYAKRLLATTALSIQCIADQSGYSDYFLFNKAFKRIAGVTPGQYRKQCQSGGD